jgi:hypothetical protein
VGDADLDDRAPRRPELDEELGREEGPTRFDADAPEGVAPEELAGTVDVGDAKAEEDPIGEPVGPRVERPDERIRTPDPEPDDGIGPALGVAGGQAADVGDPELAIPVREGDQVVAGRAEPGPQGGPVAEVAGMVDGPSAIRGVASREPSSTMTTSNVSASEGSVASASSTRPCRFASSLWAGKK